MKFFEDIVAHLTGLSFGHESLPSQRPDYKAVIAQAAEEAAKARALNKQIQQERFGRINRETREAAREAQEIIRGDNKQE